ncbi:hypothetical protein BDV19DRAFT_374765 [Aspergillus venezuelensis]
MNQVREFTEPLLSAPLISRNKQKSSSNNTRFNERPFSQQRTKQGCFSHKTFSQNRLPEPSPIRENLILSVSILYLFGFEIPNCCYLSDGNCPLPPLQPA